MELEVYVDVQLGWITGAGGKAAGAADLGAQEPDAARKARVDGHDDFSTSPASQDEFLLDAVWSLHFDPENVV